MSLVACSGYYKGISTLHRPSPPATSSNPETRAASATFDQTATPDSNAEQIAQTAPTAEFNEGTTPTETMYELPVEPPLYIDAAQASIGGISIDAIESDVLQQLGNPLIVKYEQTECCGELRYLEYRNLSVGIIEEKVYSLLTRSPEVSTADGVRVGDMQLQVIGAYGEPHQITSENNLLQLTYFVSESATLTFHLNGHHFEGGRIVEIHYSALLN